MPSSLELILQSRLVAIVRLDDLSRAVELSRALLAGGVVALEFTLTNAHALDAIRSVLTEIEDFTCGKATIGVGSVRDRQQALESIKAGAQFVVSPVFSPEVTQACVNQGVPILSGAMTPTEIAAAWAAGSSLVKVFPARGLGPAYIKDVLAPMPEIKLMPTGGVGLKNMQSYFDSGAAAVGVGGDMIDAEAIHQGDWNRVTSVASQYATLASRESAT